MKTFTGTVKNGAVRLPPQAQVRDGSKVVMAVLSEGTRETENPLVAELEAEDVAFVRACRGRIAGHMRAEER